MNTTIKNLLSIALIALASSAYADRAPLNLAPILVKNAPSGKNLAISAFYVSGSNPPFGAHGTIPYVRKIFAGPIRADIHADGTAQFPKASIVPSFEVPSFILLVIHPANQTAPQIQNADGTVASADGAVASTSSQAPDMTPDPNIRMIPLKITVNQTGIDSIDVESNSVQATLGDTITVDLAAAQP